MATQGGKANKTGSVLEKLVVGTLSAHGIDSVLHSEFIRTPARYGKELLLRHVPYTTLYGGKGHTEFLLKSGKYNVNTRIECKWQQTGGSVDEKLPYLYLSSIECMPENDVILLIDGDGFRRGAKEWIRRVAAEKRYVQPGQCDKTISVMSSTDFLTWVNNTFR